MSHNNELIEPLTLILQQEVRIDNVRPVGGGSISSAYAIETSADSYFLKANRDSTALAMFEAEGDGLATLKANSRFAIPQVFGMEKVNGVAYLLMALIKPASRTTDYWDKLGQNLADLHQVSQESFGYHRSNFIGSLQQTNQLFDSWGEFFMRERMTPMIRLARNSGLVDAGFVQKFDNAMAKIVAEMPEEPPALLHGDLWSGNLMADDHGNATIIDPAVYYGHREMDLAFTQMFGGFSDQFIRAYDEVFPLEPGFSKRVGLYNLYPYLVHLNLFGRSYFGHIENTIRQFT
jgi:protein-ribulosamine 3-kinase